ncbi:MAG: DUF2750 domain-containing protein [Myxococcaceae bacterium]|nr:DUF2750 domain-containing protein [Myxococcaceae bacterium]MCI0670574.1 DUF2750 domain-containing protein [Myxococcaceae bacterium]
MHPKKLANVTAMDARARYDYFVRRIADSEEVWGLFNDGWATAANDLGDKALPFWPERELAEVCSTAEWATYTPARIPVAEFLQKWLRGMEQEALLVAVFPTPQDKGVCVQPSKLAADLKVELDEYE